MNSNPIPDEEWVLHPQTIEAHAQWSAVAEALGADPDCPDSVIAAARAAAKPSPAGQAATFPWENFPAYLIDKCEGDTISEEGLQQALAAMAKDERYCIAARQPVGQEPVCSGGFVITNGSGEKYMAWGQVGPEWVADRSAALWLVRRADADALAAENEDAWSILPVERCALPPNGWACTLADGHEGPCPTIAAPPAQAVDLGQFREAVAGAEDFIARHSWAWNGVGPHHPNTTHEELKKLLALIDSKAVGNG